MKILMNNFSLHESGETESNPILTINVNALQELKEPLFESWRRTLLRIRELQRLEGKDRLPDGKFETFFHYFGHQGMVSAAGENKQHSYLHDCCYALKTGPEEEDTVLNRFTYWILEIEQDLNIIKAIKEYRRPMKIADLINDKKKFKSFKSMLSQAMPKICLCSEKAGRKKIWLHARHELNEPFPECNCGCIFCSINKSCIEIVQQLLREAINE